MAFAMLWGHLTSLKYLHHKQHELWGLQEGHCFKIQFPLFSTALVVSKRAIHGALYGNETLPAVTWCLKDTVRIQISGWSGQVVREVRKVDSSSLATVWDQYVFYMQTHRKQWLRCNSNKRAVNNKQEKLEGFSSHRWSLLTFCHF